MRVIISQPSGEMLGTDLVAVRDSEIEEISNIEAASYPDDEMASLESLKYRNTVASKYFRCIHHPESQVLGYVCGTATKTDLNENTMTQHDPSGHNLCIHSVVIRESARGKGWGLSMLKAYLQYVEEECEEIELVSLIAKQDKIRFYVSGGMTCNGMSKIVHGKDPWFDFSCDMNLRRELVYLQVDAFTSVPFTGNPAAVFFTQKGFTDDAMKKVAMEMNLSETAYNEKIVVESTKSLSVYKVRYFGPSLTEIDLCGHATLASAHALWETGKEEASTIRFKAKGGNITIKKGFQGRYSMSLTADPPKELQWDVQGLEGLASALGLTSGNDIVYLGKTTYDLFVVLQPAGFMKMSPDVVALKKYDCRGIIVTSSFSSKWEEFRDIKRLKPMDGYDFVSRFFAPRQGINEDPVTGSAHSSLGPFWATTLGMSQLKAKQTSPRGGFLELAVTEKGMSVEILCQAVTTLSGKLRTRNQELRAKS